MPRKIGDAFLTVRPDTSKFAPEVRASMSRAGQAGGTAYSSGFSRAISGLARRVTAAASDRSGANAAGIASGEKFKIGFVEGSRGLSSGIVRATSSTTASARAGRAHGETFKKSFGSGVHGLSSSIGGLFALAAGFTFFKSAIQGARDVERQTRITNAVIASTGHSANVTASHVRELAGSLGTMAGVEPDLIQGSENLLLTFTRIRNTKTDRIFDQAETSIVNMTAAMNHGHITQEGLQKSTLQVGKALQDPIHGATALRRVGVQLTEQQQKQIKTFVDSGNIMGAQKVILGELTKEFGGAAAAAADPATRAKVAWEEFKKSIGLVVLPIVLKLASVFTAMAPTLQHHAGLILIIITAITALVVVAKTIILLTEAWAAAQRILNLAMFSNPIGLVILAIVALVAALILAWKHSAAFRDVLIGAWHGIRIAMSAVTVAAIAVWHWLLVAFHGIAAVAIWLWAHVFAPYFGFIAAIMRGVAAVAVWLWINVIGPVFRGIAAVVVWLWSHVFGVFFRLIAAVMREVGAVARWLWVNVIGPVFRGIAAVVVWLWSHVFAVFFRLMAAVMREVGAVARWLWVNVLGPVFRAIAGGLAFVVRIFQGAGHLIFLVCHAIGNVAHWMWDHGIKPAFDAINGGVQGVGNFFHRLGGWVHDAVFKVIDWIHKFKDASIDAFNKAKDGIGRTWDGIKHLIRQPVYAVVEVVYNKGIKAMWNETVAKIPGVPKLNDVHVPEFSGGGFTGAGDKYKPAGVVHAGEFVMPQDQTRQYLPLLQMMHSGKMKKPLPGFFLGGLVGSVAGAMSGLTGIFGGKKIKNAVIGGLMSAMVPAINIIRKGIAAVSSDAPEFTKMMKAIPKKLLDEAINFLKSRDVAPEGGVWGGGGIPGITAWLRAQDHKPYIWAAAGPQGYDCSGLVSAVWNLVHGQNPYHHTFSTGDEASHFTGPPGGLFTAGWANAGERGGGSVGHTAGVFNGIPFESGGSHGNVSVGHSDVTPLSAFAHRGSLSGAENLIHAHLLGFQAKGLGAHAPLITQALALAGVPGSWGSWLATLVGRESSWNVFARSGAGALGLAQLLPGTFAAYHLPGLSTNIFDPLANLVASLRYIKARYGTIFNVQQANASMPPKWYSAGGLVGSFDRGGWLMPGHAGYNGTRKPELMTPEGGTVRLHPQDLKTLGEIIGAHVARSIGTFGNAVARNADLYYRG